MELRRRGGAPVTFSAHVFPTSVGFESHKQRFGGAFSFILLIGGHAFIRGRVQGETKPCGSYFCPPVFAW
jgi:hypothetical protein